MTSCWEAEVARSFRRRDFSVRVPRQYLNTVRSETGFPLLLHEFVASLLLLLLLVLLSVSDDELYISSLPSKILPFDLSTCCKTKSQDLQHVLKSKEVVHRMFFEGMNLSKELESNLLTFVAYWHRHCIKAYQLVPFHQ